MTRYERSFTPTFFNESLNLPKQVSKLVSQKWLAFACAAGLWLGHGTL
ncbi:hypothetical protein [Candidatus Chloroploca sp. Khr17]|nr:hypothetical protein [Candidatus Chloroploca sp. Khr17]